MNISDVFSPLDGEGIRRDVNAWLVRAGIGYRARDAWAGWIPQHQLEVCSALDALARLSRLHDKQGAKVSLRRVVRGFSVDVRFGRSKVGSLRRECGGKWFAWVKLPGEDPLRLGV